GVVVLHDSASTTYSARMDRSGGGSVSRRSSSSQAFCGLISPLRKLTSNARTSSARSVRSLARSAARDSIANVARSDIEHLARCLDQGPQGLLCERQRSMTAFGGCHGIEDREQVGA